MKSGNELRTKEVDSFINILRVEHKEITKWLENKKKEMIKEFSQKSDLIDAASDHEMYLQTKNEVERKQARLLKIEERLKNMGDFGHCIECGIEISKERLKIDATFKRCTDCSSIKSSTDKHYMQ